MLERRFDDDWFIGYRHHLLEPSTYAFKERRAHLVHNIIHSARLEGGVDQHIEQDLRRLPPGQAGAIRAHMQFYRACLLSTGLVPADTLVNAAVQIEWFWYSTAFTAFYRDHLAHVMKVAAIGLSLFQDDSPLSDGKRPLLDVVSTKMASARLGSPAIRAAARRCGNSADVLEDPAFWKAAVRETIRLAGLLHDMAHPAVIASRMSRIAAPVRPLSPFEPTETDLARHTVASFGHRLLATPFNRGELPDSKGLAAEDADICAEVFTQSHSLRAGYAIVRLAEDADRVWQLSPFDAFVMEWAALSVSLHDYYRMFAARLADQPEDRALLRWLASDVRSADGLRNIDAIRPCFARDPVSYVLALSDQIQDFGRVLGPAYVEVPETDRMEISVRYPCRAVTLRADGPSGDSARLIVELGPDDGTRFGATDWDYQLIKEHKESDARVIFGQASSADGHASNDGQRGHDSPDGGGGWLDHQGLFSAITVEVGRQGREMPSAPPVQAARGPVNLFYSFADSDEPLRSDLERHLSILKWRGFIADWHHRRVSAGEAIEEEVDAHLRAADVILLLVSADFLASEYCYGVEMKRALELHKSGAARVIPILVRPFDLASAPFEGLETLPSDQRPVTSWPDKDEAWKDVVQGIRRLVEEIRLAPQRR